MSRDLPIWHYPDAVATTMRILRSPEPIAITGQGHLIWGGAVAWWTGTAAPVEPLGRDLERARWRREVGLEADDVGGES